MNSASDADLEVPEIGEDEAIDFVKQYNIPGVRLDGPAYPGVPSTQVRDSRRSALQPIFLKSAST